MLIQKKKYIEFLFGHLLSFMIFLIVLFFSLLIPLLIIRIYFTDINAFISAFYLTIFFLIFIYSYITLTALACYPFRKLLKEGIHESKSRQFKIWVIADNIASLIIRPPFSRIINISALFYIPAFRLLGLKGNFFHYKTAEILDPWNVEIGKNVVVGENSTVTGHMYEKGKLILGKIKLGSNVEIGGESVISPGCQIGNNSVIGAFSFVKKNTKIGKNEIWAGIPAKKISQNKSKK